MGIGEQSQIGFILVEIDDSEVSQGRKQLEKERSPVAA
jgi:hypothetical protein